MSVVKMETQNTDYDAAQALLDLQGNLVPDISETSAWKANNEKKEAFEKAAKIIWNSLISSETTMNGTPNRNVIESSNSMPHNNYSTYNSTITSFERPNDNSPTSVSIKHGQGFYKNVHKRKNSKKNNLSNVTAPYPTLSNIQTETETNFKPTDKIHVKPKYSRTRDVGTQTDECYLNPNIEIMESTINNLWARIKALEAKLQESAEQSTFISSDNESNYDNEHFSEDSNINTLELSNDEENVEGTRRRYVQEPRKKHYPISSQNEKCGVGTKEKLKNRVLVTHNAYMNCNDLVPIGDGHASVPSRILKHINWNSYTSATRKLLTAVFTRRILATHSLTGKPSPAFPNKPAKKKLDPALVNDIVQTVVERCSVPENVVRTSITTKCADESKMFRTRQRNGKKKASKKDRENIPPKSSDSESENY